MKRRILGRIAVILAMFMMGSNVPALAISLFGKPAIPLSGGNFSMTVPSGFFLLNADQMEEMRGSEKLEKVCLYQNMRDIDYACSFDHDLVFSDDGALVMEINTRYEYDGEPYDEEALLADLRGELEKNGCQDVTAEPLDVGGNTFLSAFGCREMMGTEIWFGILRYIPESTGNVMDITAYTDRDTAVSLLSGLHKLPPEKKEEPRPASDELSWEVWTVDYVLGYDNIRCAPQDCGIEELYVYIRSDGTTLYRHNGKMAVMEDKLELPPLSWQEMWMYIGGEIVVLKRANVRLVTDQLFGTWNFQTAEINERAEALRQELDLNTDIKICFCEDGTARLENVFTLSGTGPKDLGNWLATKDRVYFFQSEENLVVGCDYKIEGKNFVMSEALELSGEMPEIAVPECYDVDLHWHEYAGLWKAEVAKDGQTEIYLFQADPDGTCELQRMESQITPWDAEQIWKGHWEPAKDGVCLWEEKREAATKQLYRDRILFIDLLKDKYGESLRMQRDSELERFFAGVQAAGTELCQKMLGVWNGSIEDEESIRQYQLILYPSGKAEYRKVIENKADPRLDAFEMESCQWQMTKGRVRFYDEHYEVIWKVDGDTIALRDGGTEVSLWQEANAEDWKEDSYQADMLVNYMQLGYVGIWQSNALQEDPYDHAGRMLTLYLAKDGTAKLTSSWSQEEYRAKWYPSGEKAIIIPHRDIPHFGAEAGQRYSFNISENNEDIMYGYLYNPKFGDKSGDKWTRLADYWDGQDGLQESNVQYRLNSEGNAVITDYFTMEAQSRIPDIIDGHPVVEIAQEACMASPFMEQIILPEGIQIIGDRAFENCSNLTAIVFPSTLRKIGSQAFHGCGKLSDFALPEGLTEIGEEAFYYLDSIQSVTIPSTLERMGQSAFAYCTQLETLEIRDGAKAISSGAFSMCYALNTVTIPGSVKIVSDSAFSGCDSLTSVVLQDGVEVVGERAFEDCEGLYELILPEGLKEIEMGAFNNCYSLGYVEIPDSVEKIERQAFAWDTALVNVKLPASLQRIEDMTFIRCEQLKSIVIPDSVTFIADNAFEYTDVELHGSESSIVLQYAVGHDLTYVIEGSSEVSTVTIADHFAVDVLPDGKLEITKYYGLDAVVGIPAEIDGVAVTSIGANAFSENGKVVQVIVPEGVAAIGDKAFFGCEKLKEVHLPATVMEFGRFVFNNCPNLTLCVSQGSYAEEYGRGKNLSVSVQ